MAQSSAESVYRIPPYVLGPQVYMAKDLDDVIDWGLRTHGIQDQWLKSKGEGIKVGIADTGRPDHPDLNDAIAGSKNFSNSFTDKDVNSRHSTHVAGVVAALENGQGVIGVAPKAKLVIAKVLGDDGSGDNRGVARGIRWLASQGCHVINLSLGGPYDAEVAAACDDAVRAGVLVICAAGNDGAKGSQNTIGYPARLASTVAIASYNQSGKLSDYSSRGPEIHVAFPGENILSTWGNDAYRRLSGTSMATPFASGVAALLLSYQNKLIKEGSAPPNLIRSNQDLLARFKDSAVDQGPVGHDKGWGWGIVDVDKMMPAVAAPPSEDPVPGEDAAVEDVELLFGMVRMRYPATLDGKQGAFIYLS